MIRFLIFTVLALAISSLAWDAYAAAPAPVAGTACEKLQELEIQDVTITSASAVPAGPFSAPGMQKPMNLPAFCRVQAVATPTSDSRIGFEVWLPVPDAWNGKFQGTGTGSFQGAIGYSALAAGLLRGYAVTSTDMGHTGDNLEFAKGHPEKLQDWAWRAIHVTAEAGKLITRDAMGRWPRYSYFVGCSSGGHQALSEAQRFPADYDGIVAGDPGNDRLHELAGYLWAWLALHDETGTPLFTEAKLQFVTRSARAVCADKDGVIEDPSRCGFDPASLLCKGDETDRCLTAAQVAAVKKVYAPLKNPRTGEEIWPGWSIGSEGFGDTAAQGWGEYLALPKNPRRLEFFNYFLFQDPNWDYRSFDFDKDVAAEDQRLGFMAAVDHDLTPFHARGGKLVMTTGWSDPIVPPRDVIKYYEGVAAKMGGVEKIKSFFRFFMAPGMGHCGNGNGPNSFDSLGALEQWVEHGNAPDNIIAAHVTNGVTDRTRPLCAYPAVAQWTGKGSTDDAANFVCKVLPLQKVAPG